MAYQQNRNETEYNFILGMLSDHELWDFMKQDLRNSLTSVGFSNELITDLLENLKENFDVLEFGKKHSLELREVYTIGFFQKFSPAYYAAYVVPEIPAADKVLDVGCGTGFLVNLISKETRFKKIVGIDLHPYPEWEQFSSSKVTFKVVSEESFPQFIKTEKPGALTMTWLLHHMEYIEQERYLSYIHNAMHKGSKVVILEDSYSTELQPENGLNIYSRFMRWNVEDRKKIMSIYDWVANRILAQRRAVPIPFAYRTAEEWQNLFKRTGFQIIKKKFIGFPEHRDINIPQSLIVISA